MWKNILFGCVESPALQVQWMALVFWEREKGLSLSTPFMHNCTNLYHVSPYKAGRGHAESLFLNNYVQELDTFLDWMGSECLSEG